MLAQVLAAAAIYGSDPIALNLLYEMNKDRGAIAMVEALGQKT